MTNSSPWGPKNHPRFRVVAPPQFLEYLAERRRLAGGCGSIDKARRKWLEIRGSREDLVLPRTSISNFHLGKEVGGLIVDYCCNVLFVEDPRCAVGAVLGVSGDVDDALTAGIGNGEPPNPQDDPDAWRARVAEYIRYCVREADRGERVGTVPAQQAPTGARRGRKQAVELASHDSALRDEQELRYCAAVWAWDQAARAEGASPQERHGQTVLAGIETDLGEARTKQLRREVAEGLRDDVVLTFLRNLAGQIGEPMAAQTPFPCEAFAKRYEVLLRILVPLQRRPNPNLRLESWSEDAELGESGTTYVTRMVGTNTSTWPLAVIEEAVAFVYDADHTPTAEPVVTVGKTIRREKLKRIGSESFHRFFFRKPISAGGLFEADWSVFWPDETTGLFDQYLCYTPAERNAKVLNLSLTCPVQRDVALWCWDGFAFGPSPSPVRASRNRARGTYTWTSQLTEEQFGSAKLPDVVLWTYRPRGNRRGSRAA